jgi:hypothetical protein
MSLFLVTKKGDSKKTFGVYKVFTPETGLGLDADPNDLQFLIWDEDWKIVHAQDYEPEEFDMFNVPEED